MRTAANSRGRLPGPRGAALLQGLIRIRILQILPVTRIRIQLMPPIIRISIPAHLQRITIISTQRQLPEPISSRQLGPAELTASLPAMAGMM